MWDRKQLELLWDRNVELEKIIAKLRGSIKSKKEKLTIERQSVINFKSEVTNLTKLLNESEINMKIKIKMLDDQNETIEKLKSDMKNKDNEIEECYEEIESLKQKKNALNEKYKQLEEEKQNYKNSYDEINQDLDKQKSLFYTLDNKLQFIKHENELKYSIIISEKEQALRAAQFATNKLQETMDDFQKQSEMQMRIRQALTKLLQEKDTQLKAIIKKMNGLTFDSQKVIDALKVIKPKNKTIPSDSNSETATKNAYKNHEKGDYKIFEDNVNVDEIYNRLKYGFLGDYEEDLREHLSDNNDCKSIENEDQDIIEQPTKAEDFCYDLENTSPTDSL